MAINKNGVLSGQVGPLVYRNVDGDQIVQTKPKQNPKQTAATKEASIDFGIISKTARLIRSGLIETHQKLYDSKMVNRLNEQVSRALRANPDQTTGLMSMDLAKLKRLVDFQFNADYHMHDVLYLDPEIKLSDKAILSIDLPGFDILRAVKMPENCRKIALNFNLMAIDFKMQKHTAVGNIVLEAEAYINHSKVDPQSWQVNCSPYQNQTLFVGLHIDYLAYHGKYLQILNSKTCHPASIVAAFHI